ncbi:MAG: hypothetical protein AB7G21_10920 [Dehalococcoidia bacterium]
MITLSSTLLTAQQSASATPSLRVLVSDRDVGVARMRFTRWYTGAEPDGPSGAAVPADGSLVRARIDAATSTLYAQRVATPDATSTYSVWTSLGTVTAAARLGLHATGTRVLLATVASGGVAVQVRESTDSGATFGAASTVATAAGAVAAVACAVRADGSAAVAWAVGGTVYSSRRTGGGGWSAAAAWSNSLASVNAIAMSDASDYAVLVSGATSAGLAGVWTTRLGSGQSGPPGVWLPLTEVAAAGAGTNVTYVATGIGTAGASRLAFVEVFAGTGAYSRVQLSHAIAGTSFDDQMWREPQPTSIVAAYGAAFAGGGDDGFLCTPGGVWHASSEAASTDLSADVLEARLEEDTRSARLRLRLRNDDARYAVGSAPASLAPGGEVVFEPGCVTSAGAEHAFGRRYWIRTVRRVRANGASIVDVEAEGAWDALAQWRAPRQIVWAAGASSAYAVLREIARRAGVFLYASGQSAESSALTPAYTVRAGERGDRAFARLLERLPDEARARGTNVTLTEPDAAETATYAYDAGGEAHPVASIRAVEERRDAGWARVFGAGLFAEAVDEGAIAGGAGAAVLVDDNLTSTARAIARADAALRRARLEGDAGELVAPPHAGQEVGDVIEVTDAALGLAAAAYRVTSLRFDYVRTGRAPKAVMTLGLGEV